MLDPTLAPRASPTAGRKPIVVLLVDDQAFTGSVIALLLGSEQDIELHCCLSAPDAIASANAIDPTVILQDLVMPDIDGLTLVRAFRANPQTAGTPVVVLSGNDDAPTRSQALANGARGYLVKLPPKDALIACIRHQAARSAGGRNTLDLSAIDAFREAGAPDFTRRVIDQFSVEAVERVRTLHDAAGGDGRALTAAAHSLKGSSLIMGASKLAGLCAQVEDQVTAGGDVAQALIAEIDAELVRLQQALAVQRERIGEA